MEPHFSDNARAEAPRNELRALAQLRDRVEAAAREVERLREENAALAERVAALQSGQHRAAAGPALPGSDDPEKLKAQVRAFIEAIDRVLHTPEAADAVRRRDG